MSSFEYVMFLFSIIVGLAITTLIDGFVRAFRRHTGLRPGPIHTLWGIALFGYIILFWVSRWDWAGAVTEWTPGLVLTSLLLPMAVYGWAAILFPPKGEDVALDDYFIDNRRALFGVAILVLIAQFIGGRILFGTLGQFPGTPVTGISLALVAIYALMMWTPNRRAHLAVAVLVALVMIGFFVRPLTIVQ